MTTEERKKVEEWAARRRGLRQNADERPQFPAEESSIEGAEKIESEIKVWAKHHSIINKKRKV